MSQPASITPGQLLFQLLERAQQIEEEHDHDPQDGSMAHQELADLERELTGDWFSAPVASVHSIGDLAFGSAMEHLEALSLALDNKNLVLSVFTLARAGLETSARAWWILDTTISGRTRVSRGLTELLYGWRQMLKIGPPLVDLDDTEARIKRVVDGALEKTFDLLPNKDRRAAPELDERRPTTTDIARQVLETSLDPKTGQELFRVYSAIAHATVPGLVTMFEASSESDAQGRQVGRFSMDPVMSMSILGFSILGFDKAFRERARLNGWDEGESFHQYRAGVAGSMQLISRSVRELMDGKSG